MSHLPDPRPTLLIADDEAFMRSALGSQLDRAFRIVAVAKDTIEAIALAERHRPDAALIDVEMPGGGALTAVPRIDACSPDTCMVILSGDESRRVVLELLSAGAIAYVRKGGGASALVKTLNEAIAAKACSQPVTVRPAVAQLSAVA